MTQNKSIQINERLVGATNPSYIIAEMSANHGQDFGRAAAIIEAAKDAGADAIKLQTYTPETMTINSDKEFFRIGKGTLWEGKTLYDLYAEAYTPWEWFPKIKQLADNLKIDMFSSVFDFTSLEFLKGLDVPAYKIASFELTDLPLLKKVAQTGKPIILSTGLATIDEIDEAVNTVRSTGNDNVALLKCTSAYPADPSEMNLSAMQYFKNKFKVVVGLSDHTLGTTASTVAVALGAKIIEKHITISRDTASPDQAFSLDPKEFKNLVSEIRIAESALGTELYTISEKEEASRAFRRSLFVVKDIQNGEIFTSENIRSIRPGNGLAPKYFDDVIGKRSTTNLEAGTPLEWKHIDSKNTH